MTGILSPKGIMVRKGDSFTIAMQFKTSSGSLDISGAKIKMEVRDADERVLMTKVAEITDAVNGRAAIELTPEDTDLDPGEYKTDIQTTYANGQVHTIYPQKVCKVACFKITPHVTE